MRTYTITAHDDKGSNKSTQVVKAANDKEFDDQIGHLIMTDRSLTYEVIGEGGEGGFSSGKYYYDK